MHRIPVVALLGVAGLCRLVAAASDAALGLCAMVLSISAALAAAGYGLLRMVRWEGSWTVVWPAALCTGLSVAAVVTALPLVFGLGAAAQAMALWLAAFGLGTAAVLAPPPTHLPTRAVKVNPFGRGERVVTRPAEGRGRACWLSLGVAFLCAATPLLLGGAWSVAGHDLDTLQHQDGPLHATMALLCAEGQRPAPGYPIGMHALISGLSAAAGLSVFQALCVVMLLLPVAATAGVCWAASAAGAGPTWAGVAGLMCATHPLLILTGMEQFAPQLCAAALVPALMGAALAETRAPSLAGRALLPALILAAILSVYGLAMSVALPLVVVCVLRMRPALPSVKRLVIIGLLAGTLAPLGVARLAQRFSGSRQFPQSPVKAAARAASPAAGDARTAISPDVERLGDAGEATHALRWSVTAAHLAGVSPYRDHFMRSARMAQTTLGRGRAEPVVSALGAWASAAVPVLTLLLGLLCGAGVVWAGRRRPSVALALGWAAVAAAGAVWLGAGAGIRPYYGFKVGSLAAPLIGVALALGLQALSGAWRGRLTAAALLVVAVARAPALMAVEGEYARGLALDQDFVAVMGSTLAAARGRPAWAADPSPTRRYWESRFLLTLAKEVEDAGTADVVLCAPGAACPAPASWRTVAESGGYRLAARR